MSSKLWIDVTDLLAWEGPPTGITRVARNLAIQMADRPDVAFFAFSDGPRTFRRIGAAELLETADRRGGGSSGRIGPVRTAWLKATRALVSQARRRTPASVKRTLRRIDLPIFEGSPHLQLRRRPLPDAPFSRGDRVLIVGAGWESPHLQLALAEQKRSRELRVYQILYDLTPILLPHTFGPGFSDTFARYLLDACSISDGLLAISECTRIDAKAFCRDLLVPTPPMATFRLGDEPLATDAGEQIASLAGRSFILSIGTLESRKNQLLLYQVWRLALERGRPLPDLVIVGRRGWGAGDTLAAIGGDPKVRGSIHVLESVTDPQLAWLYQACLFTVYPSLYEGWGLPIAEALARGKVCICSGTSAMPEVAGGLVDYFSPYDAAECLARIEHYLLPDTLDAMERTIKREYVATPWRASAHHLESAMRELEVAGGLDVSATNDG